MDEREYSRCLDGVKLASTRQGQGSDGCWPVSKYVTKYPALVPHAGLSTTNRTPETNPGDRVDAYI